MYHKGRTDGKAVKVCMKNHFHSGNMKKLVEVVVNKDFLQAIAIEA
jgi:hypothetical protein